jgi:hypothetical protein
MAPNPVDGARGRAIAMCALMLMTSLLACEGRRAQPTEAAPEEDALGAASFNELATTADGIIARILKARAPELETVPIPYAGDNWYPYAGGNWYRTASGNVLHVNYVIPKVTPTQEPVLVIDGEIIDGAIREDIEVLNMKVLKDRVEAVKRYGPRASHGAVVVTTQRAGGGQ